jgi:steroid delta-isomerase-like uncharacterized protein
MDTEAHKAIVQRYIEIYNTGNLAIADEILSPDFVDHLHPNRAPGPGPVKDEVSGFRTAFPDAHATIEQMIAEDDSVAFRFVLNGTHQGDFSVFPPTGKRVVLTGMDFVRIVDGKMVELWSSQDTLSWVQQLGAEIQMP